MQLLTVTLEPARWQGASIAEIGREAIAFMVEIHRERAGILREILGRAHTDPEIVERKEQLIAYICERLQRLLLERRQEISHPDPETAVRLRVPPASRGPEGGNPVRRARHTRDPQDRTTRSARSSRAHFSDTWACLRPRLARRRLRWQSSSRRWSFSASSRPA